MAEPASSVLPARAPAIMLAGAVGVVVSVLAAFWQPSAGWMIPFFVAAAAFAAGSWYTLPVRGGSIERRWTLYLVAGFVGLFDAAVLTLSHADMNGWETLFIAAHYLAGTAFLMSAADGLRRATGH